ncbi:hypothetical protein BJ508DRAFT_48110 [Ascobolus immersus RN42]|uniref:Uncharacterized protein n=1 Tax=Ascobolus immersus RN42 TaxID=1160509 RepID=A0A3N4HI17_ASCIM|nr:hypothetical protein BJ508DRAFT_48110 [Ascobolus immersus RN42]
MRTVLRVEREIMAGRARTCLRGGSEMWVGWVYMQGGVMKGCVACVGGGSAGRVGGDVEDSEDVIVVMGWRSSVGEGRCGNWGDDLSNKTSTATTTRSKPTRSSSISRTTKRVYPIPHCSGQSTDSHPSHSETSSWNQINIGKLSSTLTSGLGACRQYKTPCPKSIRKVPATSLLNEESFSMVHFEPGEQSQIRE